MKTMGRPRSMFPHEARLRNFTYASAMTVDLDIKIIHRYGDTLQQCEIHYKLLPRDTYWKVAYYGEI